MLNRFLYQLFSRFSNFSLSRELLISSVNLLVLNLHHKIHSGLFKITGFIISIRIKRNMSFVFFLLRTVTGKIHDAGNSVNIKFINSHASPYVSAAIPTGTYRSGTSHINDFLAVFRLNINLFIFCSIPGIFLVD